MTTKVAAARDYRDGLIISLLALPRFTREPERNQGRVAVRLGRPPSRHGVPIRSALDQQHPSSPGFEAVSVRGRQTSGRVSRCNLPGFSHHEGAPGTQCRPKGTLCRGDNPSNTQWCDERHIRALRFGDLQLGRPLPTPTRAQKCKASPGSRVR
jgi:hypothetical protein